MGMSRLLLLMKLMLIAIARDAPLAAAVSKEILNREIHNREIHNREIISREMASHASAALMQMTTTAIDPEIKRLPVAKVKAKIAATGALMHVLKEIKQEALQVAVVHPMERVRTAVNR
jgi:hypothetical protein